MKAVVMAGGQGSRLRPLTINRPKPMVPLVDKPVVVHIVELLKRHGITEVVLTLQYMADMMQDMALGLKMMRRGKIKLRPQRIDAIEEVRELFRRAEEDDQ